jgi:hypothetical protein
MALNFLKLRQKTFANPEIVKLQVEQELDAFLTEEYQDRIENHKSVWIEWTLDHLDKYNLSDDDHSAVVHHIMELYRKNNWMVLYVPEDEHSEYHLTFVPDAPKKEEPQHIGPHSEQDHGYQVPTVHFSV